MNSEAVYHHKKRWISQGGDCPETTFTSVKVEVRGILPLLIDLLMICKEGMSVLLNRCQKTSSRDAVGQLLIQMKKMLQRKM